LPRLALALLLYTAQRRSDVVKMGRQHVRAGVLTVKQAKTGAVCGYSIHLVDGVTSRYQQKRRFGVGKKGSQSPRSDTNLMQANIGILAFGSVIDDPPRRSVKKKGVNCAASAHASVDIPRRKDANCGHLL